MKPSSRSRRPVETWWMKGVPVMWIPVARDDEWTAAAGGARISASVHEQRERGSAWFCSRGQKADLSEQASPQTRWKKRRWPIVSAWHVWLDDSKQWVWPLTHVVRDDSVVCSFSMDDLLIREFVSEFWHSCDHFHRELGWQIRETCC